MKNNRWNAPRRVAAIMLGMALTTLALADAGSGTSGRKIWYRYVDSSGQTTLSDQISETHIRLGYDMLDRNMQVIRHFPAFDATLYQQDKAARDSAMRRQKEDARILRLYSSASDATRARDRQIEALDTSMGYNRLQLMRLNSMRANLVENLANKERMGLKPAESDRNTVGKLDLQIADLSKLIAEQKAEVSTVKVRFSPIISRLKEIEATPALASGN